MTVCLLYSYVHVSWNSRLGKEATLGGRQTAHNVRHMSDDRREIGPGFWLIGPAGLDEVSQTSRHAARKLRPKIVISYPLCDLQAIPPFISSESAKWRAAKTASAILGLKQAATKRMKFAHASF